MNKVALAVCLLGVGAGCTTVAYNYSKEPDPRQSEFVLGPSDVVRVTVWKNPELTTDARIRPDGTITLALIGDIRATLRTPTELRNEITSRLRAFVKDEVIVTIAVLEVNSYRFTVGGNVEHGGIFNTKYYVTAAEALAMAGGLNKFANGDQMLIVRPVKGGVRRVPLNYTRISSGEHPEENVVLLSGDTLFVP